MLHCSAINTCHGITYLYLNETRMMRCMTSNTRMDGIRNIKGSPSQGWTRASDMKNENVMGPPPRTYFIVGWSDLDPSYKNEQESSKEMLHKVTQCNLNSFRSFVDYSWLKFLLKKKKTMQLYNISNLSFLFFYIFYVLV